jgi:lysophospholipase L1-like esterase
MKIRIVFYFLLLSGIAFSQEIIFEEPIRYLALGDSYTIGQNVSEENRFPVQLIEKIKKDFDIEDAEVDIIAQTGWTTGNLKAAIEQVYDDSKEYNLVSLLIGVNNQYQRRDIDGYGPDFTDLLKTAIEIAGDPDKVFVVSIPDYSYTPSHANIPGISEEIDAYNAINRDISRSYGIKYVNITSISRRGLKLPEYVASDGLHPSGIQYGEWVDAIIPRLLNQEEKIENDSSLNWNISSGNLSVQLPEIGGSLSLIDINGRILQKSKISDQYAFIPLSNIAPGVYFINYQVEDRKFTGKVFID